MGTQMCVYERASLQRWPQDSEPEAVSEGAPRVAKPWGLRLAACQGSGPKSAPL